MKSKTPLGSALAMLGYTIGVFLAVLVIGNIAVSLVFGAEAEMNWPFSLLLIFLAPFVFLGGIISAIATYTRERDCQSRSNVEESNDQEA